MMNGRTLKKASFAVAVLAILLFILMYADNNRLKISPFQIAVSTLPDDHEGLRIVHISDLHGKSFGRHNEKLAGAINKLAPDFILVSGDMINSYGDDGAAFIDLLEGLEARYPIFCSLGNHEQILREKTETDGYERFAEQIGDAGALLLDNERVGLESQGVTIGIYGLTAMLYHYSSRSISQSWEEAELKGEFVTEKLGRPREGEITILLAHNPKYFQSYVEWAPDLICAGHIHGGVVRLPLLGGVLSPDLTFFPEYSAGLYRSGETTMHVSRGLGNSVIPFRIFNPPDLSLLHLQPGQ